MITDRMALHSVLLQVLISFIRGYISIGQLGGKTSSCIFLGCHCHDHGILEVKCFFSPPPPPPPPPST